jgi:hypothetical protein
MPATRPAGQLVATTADDDDLFPRVPFRADASAQDQSVPGSARAAAGSPQIFVIAPGASGATSTSNPILYWFLSDSVKRRVEIAISEPDVSKPLCEVVLPSAAAGLHSFQIPMAHPLAAGKTYTYSVSILPKYDDDRGVWSSTSISLEQPKMQSTGTGVAPLPFWYDAMAEICQRIDDQPDNIHLRRQRRSLLVEGKVFQILRKPGALPGTTTPDDAGNRKLEDTMLKLIDTLPANH